MLNSMKLKIEEETEFWPYKYNINFYKKLLLLLTNFV